MAAQNQEEYDMWLERLEANAIKLILETPLLTPDLVGEVIIINLWLIILIISYFEKMNCGFGAVKCMELVDGRMWGGTRGGICAWNIEVIN